MRLNASVQHNTEGAVKSPEGSGFLQHVQFSCNQYVVFGRSGTTELNHTEATERELADDRDACFG